MISMSNDPDSAFRIRAAIESDRAQLIPLINSAFLIESFLEGTRTDDERLTAAMAKGTILIAEDTSGCPVGCVYVEVRGLRGHLGMLAVDPDHQGSGLARGIIEAAEDHLRQLECNAVDITVLSLRSELLPIYRRFGFVETGVEEMGRTGPSNRDSNATASSCQSNCKSSFARSRTSDQSGPCTSLASLKMKSEI
jgi:GNAT superfamily N-acetyltransferase